MNRHQRRAQQKLSRDATPDEIFPSAHGPVQSGLGDKMKAAVDAMAGTAWPEFRHHAVRCGADACRRHGPPTALQLHVDGLPGRHACRAGRLRSEEPARRAKARPRSTTSLLPERSNDDAASLPDLPEGHLPLASARYRARHPRDPHGRLGTLRVPFLRPQHLRPPARRRGLPLRAGRPGQPDDCGLMGVGLASTKQHVKMAPALPGRDARVADPVDRITTAVAMPTNGLPRIGRTVPAGLNLEQAATRLGLTVDDFKFYLLLDRIPQPISECGEAVWPVESLVLRNRRPTVGCRVLAGGLCHRLLEFCEDRHVDGRYPTPSELASQSAHPDQGSSDFRGRGP